MYLCYSCICVTGTYQTDKFWTLEDGWGILGDWKKCCGNGWGWKSNAAGTDGDGNHVWWGRMGMDTASAVTDGDGLIFHYRAGLYYATESQRLFYMYAIQKMLLSSEHKTLWNSVVDLFSYFILCIQCQYLAVLSSVWQLLLTEYLWWWWWYLH